MSSVHSPNRFAMLATFLLVGIGASYSIAQSNNPLVLSTQVKARDRICFALYTVHENTLKLTAQFYPLKDFEPFSAKLQIERNGQWVDMATSDIAYPGYTATFRVENWDDTSEAKYRVAHNNTAFYEGMIRRNPRDRREFVMASLTCNSVYPRHGGDISRSDIVDNLKKIQPDLLFFSGDQVYDHSEHYLYWLKFGRDFGEIIRNTPTICLPDDHDVGQANLWGSGGKRAASRRGEDGGYYMPVEYVREVERAQTSHLPDPFDPTPIQRGIGVYYTQLTWGGVSFAIIEDRKFKTGPSEVRRVPAKGMVEAVNAGDAFDPNQLNDDAAKLLGDRQLKFLESWVSDWRDAKMKTVLSQTVFSQVCNYSGKHERELLMDFDSNGWPKVGRDKALSVIRKGFAAMICGDQHLGSVVQHGISEWGDAGYSFCTPAIANYWLRWWDPAEPGQNRRDGSPRYTGDYLDGFQNHMTVFAVANPTVDEKAEGGKLSTRAAGFGVVRFDKTERKITFECWPRNVDITSSNAKQYPGWPVTISQMDNCRFAGGFQLPTLEINRADQVVTIFNAETNQSVSSLRISGKEYQPGVPGPGSYRIEVGEGDQIEQFDQVVAEPENQNRLVVQLPGDPGRREND